MPMVDCDNESEWDGAINTDAFTAAEGPEAVLDEIVRQQLIA